MTIKSLCDINYSLKLKELGKIGLKIFEDWNYYLFLSSIAIMYVTIHIYFYLDGLTLFHSDMIENIVGYKDFLDKLYGAGITFAIIFALVYMYAMVSYTYYSVNGVQKANIDPILINLFYFALLCSSLKYNNYDDGIILYFSFLAFLPVIIIVYFMQKRIYLKIKSKTNISKRVLQILLLSFVVENFSYISLSYQLSLQDMKDKFVQKTLIKTDEEKKKILNKINNTSNGSLLRMDQIQHI